MHNCKCTVLSAQSPIPFEKETREPDEGEFSGYGSHAIEQRAEGIKLLRLGL